MDLQHSSQESTAATLNKEEAKNNFMPNSKASVIIVRDFDKPLEVDKGFQNKIVRLAETSKSPFILICGRKYFERRGNGFKFSIRKGTKKAEEAPRSRKFATNRSIIFGEVFYGRYCFAILYNSND